ncbi:MAG: DEAD/DEAH box helicase [Acidimicrobiales bacterium]|nr:DEAD/DEAH box helicase [Acidimicrobiales bacterium]
MTTVSADAPELYRWQLEALTSWLRCGRRGVIEAVTGSGKTDVAIAAAADARRRGRFVLVLVPSRVLMEQWYQRLTEALPDERIGRLGDRGRDEPAGCDVLIATRHSAASHRPVPPGPEGGLLIADECHGLGGRVLRRALLSEYEERLGLTATLERSDDAVTDLLVPFFGGVCHRYGFEEAIADGVCARPRVAFVGVSLSIEERQEYLATEAALVQARAHLRQVRGMPREPFGAFLAAVGHLADHDAGMDGRAAREYLDAFGKRRQIVAQSSGKYQLLGRFATLITEAEGALLFTETVRAANHAINRLDPLVSIDLITGTTARRQRKDILDDLRGRRLDAVAAPRVLDEGIDVPDANLGIVMSASRTRRQMIQRMGRILRRKRPGVGARFVILFARDTIEDPSTRFDRDGFLDEIERIAEATEVFTEEQFETLEAFLGAPAPVEVPVVERAAPLELAELVPAGGTAGLDPVGLADSLRLLAAVQGPEAVYAPAAFLRRPGDPALMAAIRDLVADWLPPPPPELVEDSPYLSLDFEELPVVAKPKVEPRKLSTGQAPLEIAATADGFRMRCTGCGELSEPVRVRWQVLDQTVHCRCG